MIHKCDRGWHSDRWSDDQCRVCWLEKSPANQRYVGSPVTSAQPTRPGTQQRISLAQVATCEHRGALTHRPSNCSNTWKYSCGVFGECTLAKCETCASYVTEATTGPPRHLAYYVYPVTGNGIWQRNVEQLLERIDLFNGRRVISIATGSSRHKLDSPDEVRKALGSESLDFMLVPHGARKLGEVTAFVPMMSRLQHLPGYMFYAHTKGVTKSPFDQAVHRWATAMYRANLDRWDIVEPYLQKYVFTGAFLKCGPAFGGRITHHYTGTFWWARLQDLSKRDWRCVPARYGGTEMFPGLVALKEECGCHFFPADGRSLYNPRTIEEIETEWQKM